MFTFDTINLQYSFAFLNRVEEYISQGKDGIVVDPDLNSLYMKRKLAKQSDTAGQNYVLPTSSSSSAVQLLQVRSKRWIFQIMAGAIAWKTAAFYQRWENQFIEKSGKHLGSSHHSVPASWRKAKPFLADEYLKDVQCASDETHFYFPCRC